MNQHTLNYVQAASSVSPQSTQSDSAEILADIYREDINIATWQRSLSSELADAVQSVLASSHNFRLSTSVTPSDAFDSLYDILGAHAQAQLISEDVAEIVAMFCCLFDLKQAGLRLTTLDRAMCPKFHVDRVPCRLVSTYSGIATQWLSHQDVNREKLGIGSQGKRDEESGLYRTSSDVRQLSAGDVSLLKGESWLGNEGAGLVHRSPTLVGHEKRLLLTLDFN